MAAARARRVHASFREPRAAFRVGFRCLPVRAAVRQAVTAPGHLDDLGPGEQAVEDGSRSRHVSEQFSPVLDGTVRGHERRPRLVTAQDDLKKDLATSGGQFLQSHVVDDEQLGLEVARQEAVFLGCSPFGTQAPTSGQAFC